MEFETFRAIKDNYSMLVMAEEMDDIILAGQLTSIGFECKRCGECCRSHQADNSVLVFPDEVLRIMDANNLGWYDVCKPSSPQFIDNKNTLHSLEWELKRHNNGSCTFLNDDNTCSIYFWRPWICRTYPFYLHFEDERAPLLNISECEGVGSGVLRAQDAENLALLLKERLISEIQEEIHVLEHLDGLENWKLFNSSIQGNNAKFNIVVHDSHGCTIVETHIKQSLMNNYYY
ncbi:MAG: YkgJ family cysteine cluster protein [ANME-2 cluster archaeon]|nr:YkgJ family cysteine cluster protein [ANME-2 cluster archaeon]